MFCFFLQKKNNSNTFLTGNCRTDCHFTNFFRSHVSKVHKEFKGLFKGLFAFDWPYLSINN